MKRPHMNDKGFAHVGLMVMVIIVIAAIFGTGWYVVSKQKKADNSQASQATTTSSAKPASANPEDVIKKISADIPPQFSQITIDTRGDGTSYSSYQVSGYKFVTLHKVDKGQFVNFKPTSGYTLDTVPSDLKASLVKIFEESSYSEDTSQPTPAYYASEPGGAELHYKKDDVRCSADITGGSSTPLQVSCSYIQDFEKDAKALKSFDDAYKAANPKYADSIYVIGDQGIKDSQTPGYKTANISFGDFNYGDGFGTLFYSKNNGPWTYFQAGQSTPSCGDFNSADLKAAFKGFDCYDSSNSNSTVQ